MRLCFGFVLLLWPTCGQTVAPAITRVLRTGAINASTIDSAGFLYVAGRTTSPDFPATSDAFQPEFRRTVCGSGDVELIPCGDAFVAKLDIERQQVVWATYLGGSSDDAASAIQVDLDGSVYVGGATWSVDFPVTPGAAQTAYSGPMVTGFRRRLDPGGDLFVVKLSSQGDRLVYSTYYGGPSVEAFAFMRVDPAGQVFVAGTTSGPVPVSAGAYQSEPAFEFGRSSFAFKVTSDGSRFAYATFISGLVSAIDIDADGNLYATGNASTELRTTADAYQRSPGGRSDAFLLKLDPAGTRAVYATWFGGSEIDSGASVAVDGAGNAWVAGTTMSPELRDGNASSPFYSFLVRFESDGTNITALRVIDSSDLARVSVSAGGDVVWTGSASRRTLPTTEDALLSAGCDSWFNSYMVQVAADGTLRTATYLPPGQVLAVDADGIYYLSQEGVARLPLRGPAVAQLFCSIHAAAFSAYPGVAPGQMLTLLGAGLGPDTPVGPTIGSDGRVTKEAGGTIVTFNGIPAPILYAYSKQIDVVAPFGIAGNETVQLMIQCRGGTFTTQLPVVEHNVGIFTLDGTGRGPAAARNQDGSVNSAANPAALGSIISLLVTGVGLMEPPQQDGEVTGIEPARPKLPLRVFITGPREAEVLSARAAPGLVAGVVEIRIRLADTADPTLRFRNADLGSSR